MAVTISEVKETFSANGKTRGYALEYRGLSTDSKPTEGVINGAAYIEIDTGKVYLFDAVGVTWNEI